MEHHIEHKNQGWQVFGKLADSNWPKSFTSMLSLHLSGSIYFTVIHLM